MDFAVHKICGLPGISVLALEGVFKKHFTKSCCLLSKINYSSEVITLKSGVAAVSGRQTNMILKATISS